MNVNRLSISFAAGIGFLLLLVSCSHKPAKSPEDAAKAARDSKTLNIVADEDLQIPIDQQVEVFRYNTDSLYVNTVYKEESKAFDAFSHKQAEVLIMSRPLTKAEDDMLTADTFYTKQLPVAYTAVALLGNKQFNDADLDTTLLKSYFASTDTTGKVPRLIFLNRNSGIVNYMVNRLGSSVKQPANVFAVDSLEGCLKYLEQNTNAIAFVPYSVISMTDDEDVKKIYERVKVLSLRTVDKTGKQIRTAANQSDLAIGTYPFVQTIYVVTHYGVKDDLESMFCNFIYKERGARLFQKAGLLPHKMNERVIIVNTGGLKEEE